MKLLVSGVPCSGKTFFGEWLRAKHGWIHVDLESPAGFELLRSGINPAQLGTLGENVIVTWGFPPSPDAYRLVGAFKQAGFEAWWFDADLQFARLQYLKRDGVQRTRQYFDPQAAKLRAAKSEIESIYQGRTIRTLETQGRMNPTEILRRLS